MLKPNHICKNRNCTKGKDGGRKHYYACDYCDKTQQWRSMGCCPECFQKYMSQIESGRSADKSIDLYPERIDLSHDEIVELVHNTTLEEIKNKTLEELSDYSEDIETIGLSRTIGKINDQMDRAK